MEAKLLMLLMILSLGRRTLAGLRRDKFGPFDLILKYPENCGDPETAQIKFDLRVRRTSRTALGMEGSITTYNLTIDNDIKLRSTIQLFTSAGWKDNFLNYDFGTTGLCTLRDKYLPVKDENFIMLYYSQTFDENNRSLPTCNIPPGVYTIAKPIQVSFDGFNGPYAYATEFTYGKFRVNSKLYYQDFEHQVGCISVYFDTVPKRGKKTGTRTFSLKLTSQYS